MSFNNAQYYLAAINTQFYLQKGNCVQKLHAIISGV